MATEIERKFLVKTLPDVEPLEGSPMIQGYLRADDGAAVRVRITEAGAFLNIKGPTRGISRAEFEYAIPPAEARSMLDSLCVGRPIEKVRYRIRHGGHVWELDVFSGDNQGLVIAEVELTRDDEVPDLPEWVGREVSGDARYYNAALALHPFSQWQD
jgi:adenylate cyclase